MKIIKYGDSKGPKVFVCKECGCEVEADNWEYIKVIGLVNYYACVCPECGGEMRDKIMEIL